MCMLMVSPIARAIGTGRIRLHEFEVKDPKHLLHICLTPIFVSVDYFERDDTLVRNVSI